MKETKEKKLVVLVCGVAGSGKSVLCEKIALHFGLEYVPTSGLLRQMMEKELAKQKINVTKNTGFWESIEGKKFLQERLKNGKFDKELDAELFNLVEKGNIVLDSWTMPWLSKKGFKIWLTASDKIRFERLSNRNNNSSIEVAEKAKAKETDTIAIYKKNYGFDWGKDLSVFDLIIDTDNLNEQEVFEKAKKAIETTIASKAF